MPDVVEMIPVLLRQTPQAEIREDLVEDDPVQLIDGEPGELPVPHPVHRRAISPSPGIRKPRPVDIRAPRTGEELAFANDRAAPIDHRPEDVEGEGVHPRIDLLAFKL